MSMPRVGSSRINTSGLVSIARGGNIGAAGAHQSCESQDFPAAKRKADVTETTGLAESTPFEDGLSRLSFRFRCGGVEFAAHHCGDQSAFIPVRNWPCGDVPAVA